MLWGLRLAIYIGWRNHGKGEDPRYAAMLGDDHPPGALTAHVLRKVYLPQAGVMIVVVLFVLFYIWVRGTLPRFRFDQLMNFGWKFLLPLSILSIVISATLSALGWI